MNFIRFSLRRLSVHLPGGGRLRVGRSWRGGDTGVIPASGAAAGEFEGPRLRDATQRTKVGFVEQRQRKDRAYNPLRLRTGGTVALTAKSGYYWLRVHQARTIQWLAGLGNSSTLRFEGSRSIHNSAGS